MRLQTMMITALLFGAVQGANILCFFGTPSYSHQITFHPIVRELNKRGHRLTVITPNPLRDPTLTNVDEIDVEEISYTPWLKHNISSMGTREELKSTDLSVMWVAFIEIMEAQLGHPRVQDLIQNSTKYKFDVIIVEALLYYNTLFKGIYNAPLIGITSLPLQMNAHTVMGNFEHTSLYPELNLPYGKKLTFIQKVYSFLYTQLANIILHPVKQIIYNIMKKYYGAALLEAVDIFRPEVDIMLVNFNPLLHATRPNVPAIIDFNGIHIKPPQELPAELKSYLDSAKNGVVYISFGSNIKSSLLPVHKREMILQAMSELSYNFLWKFESELEKLPSNVKIIKWSPQQDILRHPNVQLFVTQGGLQSLDEAMYTKTPVLAIPFFGDQHGNAIKVVESGIGQRLNFISLTKEDFKEAIVEVVSNDKYKLRMEEVYNILTDEPMSAVDKTVWWIEYVIRHKGARHMRSRMLDATFIEYYLIDVIGFLLGVVLLALFFIYMGVKLMIKLAKKYFFARGYNAQKLKIN